MGQSDDKVKNYIEPTTRKVMPGVFKKSVLPCSFLVLVGVPIKTTRRADLPPASNTGEIESSFLIYLFVEV